MKRIILLLWIFAMLCASACAEEAEKLPQAVLDLCESVHPGYAVAAHDGWGDEEFGQFAVILKKGDDNILCMAERAQDEPAYQLTIDNTNAVCDGEVLPSVLIDSGGDSLWYTYVDRAEDSSVHYNAFKTNGQWGCVSVLAYWPKKDGFTGMMSGISDGALFYEETDEDENENIRNRWTYAPVYADETFEESLLLKNFNINTFDPDPRDGLYPMMQNEAFVLSQSVTGEMLEDMAVSPAYAARLFKMADGTSMLRIDEWNGGSYGTADDAVKLGFSVDAALDAYHAGEDNVLVNAGAMMYAINRVDEGCWALRGVDAESGVRTIGPDYAAPDGQTTVYRNDGYIYGASPWGSLKQAEIALASSYEEIAAQMDQSAYALVNNPNPADRLHLRAVADKGSYSYGKFYNRTPVLVLKRGDTWTKVRLGCGENAMTGFMMTKFLVFGEEEKAQLACAFPQMDLKEEYREHGALMLAEPNRNAASCGMYKHDASDFIIGVSGGEWYVVLRSDGTVGYVLQEAFWSGNG